MRESEPAGVAHRSGGANLEFADGRRMCAAGNEKNFAHRQDVNSADSPLDNRKLLKRKRLLLAKMGNWLQ
jgi:hypothetical protein